MIIIDVKDAIMRIHFNALVVPIPNFYIIKSNAIKSISHIIVVYLHAHHIHIHKIQIVLIAQLIAKNAQLHQHHARVVMSVIF